MSELKAYAFDTTKIRDLSPEALDQYGRLRLASAQYWAATTREERGLFGHRNGLYSFPTIELVQCLDEFIAGRSAIEIGAGHGVLAEALGIPATDSRQQDKEPYRSTYALTRQPTVPYGPNVIECDAAEAMRQFKPQVVIGCWVTHRYDPARHEAGGNEVGVDELDLLRHCEQYVLVGHETVHRHSLMWNRPHKIEYPSFVYSRAQSEGRDFIATWRGRRKRR